jgi:allophanate hydrolase
MVRDPARGAAIEVEFWDLAPDAFGRFVAAIPAPLGIGAVELIDGTRAPGFLCESFAVEGTRDITRFGGWRAYVNQ